MAKEGAVAEEIEENKDAIKDDADQETLNADHEQADTEDSEQGTEGEKVGDDGESSEGETGLKDGEESTEPDERDTKITALEKEIADIRAGQKPKEEGRRAYTDDEKTQIETRYGGMPFTQVEAIMSAVARMVGNIQSQNKDTMSQFSKPAILSDLAKQKGFADIGSYSAGIDEYLKKFTPSESGNKETIEDAYHWAKGKGLKNAIRKAVNTTEKNRKVATIARPAAAGGGVAPSKGAFKFKLTPAEESAFENIGKQHFKTKEDYAKALPRYKKAMQK